MQNTINNKPAEDASFSKSKIIASIGNNIKVKAPNPNTGKGFLVSKVSALVKNLGASHDNNNHTIETKTKNVNNEITYLSISPFDEEVAAEKLTFPATTFSGIEISDFEEQLRSPLTLP